MYLFLQVKLAWPVSRRARLGALKIIGLELSTTSCNNPQVLITSQETWSTHSRHGYQGWLFLWQSLVIFEHPEHTRINHVFAFKTPKQLCCDKVICILSSEENWRDGHLWCVHFVPVPSPFRPDEKKANRYRTHWQKLSRIKKLPDFLKKNRQKLSRRLVRSQRKIKTRLMAYVCCSFPVSNPRTGEQPIIILTLLLRRFSSRLLNFRTQYPKFP